MEVEVTKPDPTVTEARLWLTFADGTKLLFTSSQFVTLRKGDKVSITVTHADIMKQMEGQ